jgi:hydroxymethylglutaryl-CoA synthase
MLPTVRCAARACTRAFSAAAGARPTNVGILAAEFYVPTRCVPQGKLEVADGVSAGKYTVGLGQTAMAFVDDREDINSIALTALARLLEGYGLDPRDIGRLEVGTESLVDKSKSTKTVLMDLLPGSASVEGATTLNACYGGTAALLNSVAWVESSEWDGRYAVYVAADIAGYEAGPARPTGGVGAVAVLVGPGAPLRLLPRTRASFASNMWDFYKPHMASEYPVVDGKHSQACYLTAVDACYQGTMHKMAAALGVQQPASLGVSEAFDYLAFHSPYNKLVQQSFKRVSVGGKGRSAGSGSHSHQSPPPPPPLQLLFNDAVRAVKAGLPLPAHLSALAPYASLPSSATLGNRELDKALGGLGGADYARMVGPSELLSKSIGNSYAAALHMNLLCLVDSLGEGLAGKRVGAFSYGSGAIATMMGLQGEGVQGSRFTLQGMAAQLRVGERLAARRQCEAGEYVEAMGMRERAYGKLGCSPVGSTEHVAAGGYYLKGVSAAGVREYARK